MIIWIVLGIMLYVLAWYIWHCPEGGLHEWKYRQYRLFGYSKRCIKCDTYRLPFLME